MDRGCLCLFVVLFLVTGPVRVVLAALKGQAILVEESRTGEVVPFTLSDRDRLIRLEEGQKSLQRQIDDFRVEMGGLKVATQRQMGDLKVTTQRQMGDLKLQIDDLKNLIYVVLTGMIGLMGGMIGMVGYVVWDRRTVVAPVAKKHLELEEREDLVERALKAYAEVESRMGEVLRSIRLIK